MVEWARIFLPALLQAGRKDGATHEPPPATPNFSKPLTDPYNLAANPKNPKDVRSLYLTDVMLQQTQLWRFRELCITPLDPLWWQSKATHSPLHPWEFALCKLTPLSILSFLASQELAPPASVTNSAAALQNSWAQDFPEVLLGLMNHPFTTGSCWTQLCTRLAIALKFLTKFSMDFRGIANLLFCQIWREKYFRNRHIYTIGSSKSSTYNKSLQIFYFPPWPIDPNLANSSCGWLPNMAYLKFG